MALSFSSRQKLMSPLILLTSNQPLSVYNPSIIYTYTSFPHLYATFYFRSLSSLMSFTSMSPCFLLIPVYSPPWAQKWASKNVNALQTSSFPGKPPLTTSHYTKRKYQAYKSLQNLSFTTKSLNNCILALLVFLEHSKLSPTSETLHMLFPLQNLEFSFPHFFKWLASWP